MKFNKSIEMIDIVAHGLDDLVGQVVFVGGATLGVYIDDPAVPEVRPTDDVDCVIEVTTRSSYYRFEEELRKRRFINSGGPNDPICRWKFMGVTVDIMPTDESILGFSNRWYSKGCKSSELLSLPSGRAIYVLTAPFYLATKMEAFLGRGQNDLRTSSDFEDIVALFNGRSKIEAEIQDAPSELKKYLQLNFSLLLKARNDLEEAVYCHLPYGSTGATRVKNILELIERTVQE